MGIRILSSGSVLPDYVVTNKDLESLIDTTDEWISTRTGILSRCVSRNEGATDLASRAAELALSRSGIDKNEVGLFICGTITPDRSVPCLAADVRNALGISSAVAFDVNSACTGFITSLITAAGVMRDLKIRYAVIIGCDLLSRITDWTDRASCVLFGDGAGAVVLEYSEEFDNLLSCGLYGESDTQSLLVCGNFWPDNHFSTNKSAHLLKMDGRGVFRFAVKAVAEEILRICNAAGIHPDDIDHFIPHQANKRIIESVAQKLNLPVERFFLNIQHLGNTSAASVPIALDQLIESGGLKQNQKILIIAFGGGLSVGSVLYRW